MMGERRVQQEALFYEFSLERHVPETHLLRHIDRFVEVDGLRRELVPFYSEMGRPSIDPELLIRMLIVGYCFGIRSERRLCAEVHLNLAYRWFCRLGLDGEVPDHSTFSKNRHGRFRDSDLLRRLFETVLQRCIAEGLVGGEGFAIDASLIQADASDRARVEGAAGLPRDAAGRAVEEYLAVLDDAAFGAATEVTPKFIAPADPATRWTAAHRGPAFFAYSNNYLIVVEDRDVRLDPLLMNQPVQHLGRAIGAVADEALGVEIEACNRPLDHALGRRHLGLTDRRRRCRRDHFKRGLVQRNRAEPEVVDYSGELPLSAGCGHSGPCGFRTSGSAPGCRSQP